MVHYISPIIGNSSLAWEFQQGHNAVFHFLKGIAARTLCQPSISCTSSLSSPLYKVRCWFYKLWSHQRFLHGSHGITIMFPTAPLFILIIPALGGTLPFWCFLLHRFPWYKHNRGLKTELSFKSTPPFHHPIVILNILSCLSSPRSGGLLWQAEWLAANI